MSVGLAKDMLLYRYGVSEAEKDRADVKIDPLGEFPVSPARATIEGRIAPMGVTVFSTYRLAHEDDGAMAE